MISYKAGINLVENLCDEMAEVAKQLEEKQSVSKNNLLNTTNGKENQDIQKDDGQIK